MKFTLFIFAVLSISSIAENAKESINIMSFNIRYGTAIDGANHWDKRKHLVHGLIKKYSPDIMGVQEALEFQMQALQKHMPSYSSLGIPRGTEGNNEYSAIFYKTDQYSVLDHGTFWLSSTPEKPSTSWGNKIFRICTWAKFQGKNSGKKFYVFNTHWDHKSKESHSNTVKLMLSKFEGIDDPIFITGDFNAGEKSKAILKLKENGFKDSYRVLHPDVKVVGTFNAFKEKRTGSKIDYVFVSKNIKIKSADIIKNKLGDPSPSDHFPVFAKVEF